MITSSVRKAAAVAALGALTIAGTFAVTTTEASAWCNGWGCNNGGAAAAGVIGGLAVGALAGAAAANAAAPPPPVYVAPGPGPVYVEEPGCYREPRRVWIDGIGWRRRMVEVCE